MREKLDDEIRKQMTDNYYKMKKIKASYTTMMFMSVAILIIQLIFFIVGGLNVYMLEGIFMNAVVFLAGTQKYSSIKLHYVLLALNFIAGMAFIIWHPVSEMLLRLGVMQHFYLMIEMYLFIRIGAQKEELSYELGYPYFTELAAYNMEEKEYVPQNDMNSGQSDMDVISEEEKQNPEVMLSEMPAVSENTDMESLDTSFVHIEFKSDSIKAENYYKDQYAKKPEIVYEEPEYDSSLLHLNFHKMKNFKLSQKAVFVLDLFLAWVFGSNALSSLYEMFKNPVEVFGIFPFIGVIISSLITVTCLDSKETIKLAMIAFAGCGVMFSILTFNALYLGTFALFAVQMLLSFRLADEQAYLKSQFGYPYFKENMIRHQHNQKEYAPQHRINFADKKMDEI